MSVPNPATTDWVPFWNLGTGVNDGWLQIDSLGTFSYNAADAPTFVMNTPVDCSGFISPGARIKLVQSGTTKYFIVTAITSTTITMYGGTDYTLANAAITPIYYSLVKCPAGFPQNPDKWTVLVSQTSLQSQSSPTANTAYNIGSNSIVIPIGVWEVDYYVGVRADPTSIGGSGGYYELFAGLETTSTTVPASPNERTSGYFYPTPTAAAAQGLSAEFALSKSFRLTLATKTTYYLNFATLSPVGLTVSIIYIRGDYYTTRIRARCAYL